MHVQVLVGHRHVPGVEQHHPILQVLELLSQHAKAAVGMVVPSETHHAARPGVGTADEDLDLRVAAKEAVKSGDRVLDLGGVGGRVRVCEVRVQVEEDDEASCRRQPVIMNDELVD